MRSKTDICNMALVQIQHSRLLDDVDTDDSPEADVCKLFYDQDRDEALEAAPWPFATRRYKPAALDATTLDSGAVPSGWSYAYAAPADLIKLRGIFDTVRNPGLDQQWPFDVHYDANLQANIILTDKAPDASVPVEFIYTARITAEALFPASFARLLALRLAPDLALGIAKDPQLAKGLMGAYEMALGNAVRTALEGVHPDPPPLAQHIRVR